MADLTRGQLLTLTAALRMTLRNAHAMDAETYFGLRRQLADLGKELERRHGYRRS